MVEQGVAKTHVDIWLVRVRGRVLVWDEGRAAAGRPERAGRGEREAERELGVEVGFDTRKRDILIILSTCRQAPFNRTHERGRRRSTHR